MSVNLHEVFLQTAQRQPGAPAILGPKSEDYLTYAQLTEAISAAADRLQSAGLKPGGTVGLHCASGADYIVLTYAVWQCRGCVVPIPTELADGEKEELCRTIALDMVITGPRGAGFVESIRRGESTNVRGVAQAIPVTAQREHPAGFWGINSAFIRFTSGTTGSAKGVVLSHETILERIAAANDVLHIGPDDRIVWLLSMSYHFAVSIVAYLSYGAGIILPANRFAAAICEAANRYRGTLIYASPAHYTWLTELPNAQLPKTLRLAVSTTAGVERQTADKFLKMFGLPLTQALGIIEVGLPFINVDFAADRPGAIGKVLPAYRLRLEQSTLGPHLCEILLSGPGFLDAYYEPWRSRDEIMPDGWFHTGDVGEVDSDGCVALCGRTKDVISVLGAKFFPQEVEAVLTSHPGVTAVAVYGRRDSRLGEAPVARVVARDPDHPPTEAELIAHCRQYLAAFKVPANIEFVRDLPRTASGKILHRAYTTSNDVNHELCHPAVS